MKFYSIDQLKNCSAQIFPGFLISALVAISAQFVSDHYGAPSMLMALLFGIALNFLSTEGKASDGIAFSASKVLRFGIGLLGIRISLDLILSLGLSSLFLIVGALILTIFFGLLIAPIFKQKRSFAFLTAGSVAICGASAALAIAAILPKEQKSEDRLVFTVVAVTLLSTVAMIVYPIIVSILGLNEKEIGVFLGATIHDVAQVVGAGFSVSNQTGELSTLVKLIRVSMLAPVVVTASLIIYSMRKESAKDQARPKIIPFFVVGFTVLATLNSLGLIPEIIKDWVAPISQWAILTAIAAVGMKTSLKEMGRLGGSAAGLIIAETLFIAILVIAGLFFLDL